MLFGKYSEKCPVYRRALLGFSVQLLYTAGIAGDDPRAVKLEPISNGGVVAPDRVDNFAREQSVAQQVCTSLSMDAATQDLLAIGGLPLTSRTELYCGSKCCSEREPPFQYWQASQQFVWTLKAFGQGHCGFIQ